MMYSEKCSERCVRRCLDFIFWKYDGWTLRNKKVIRDQATWSMYRKFRKSWNFPKYRRWWTVQASKITKIVRWSDFNALRRAHVSFTWLVKWLHPKSNIVYKGNCSMTGGRTIRALSKFDHGFLDRKWCILKIPSIRLFGPCMNFIFPKYHGWTLRNKKVIRSHATGSMDRKFGNHEIFENIDAGERLRHVKSRNSFAGAISMPCGEPTYHSHDS